MRKNKSYRKLSLHARSYRTIVEHLCFTTLQHNEGVLERHTHTHKKRGSERRDSNKGNLNSYRSHICRLHSLQSVCILCRRVISGSASPRRPPLTGVAARKSTPKPRPRARRRIGPSRIRNKRVVVKLREGKKGRGAKMCGCCEMLAQSGADV